MLFQALSLRPAHQGAGHTFANKQSSVMHLSSLSMQMSRNFLKY